MSSNRNQSITQLPAAARHYEIRLEGHLPERWSGWFEGLSITWQAGETLLSGPVADLAARNFANLTSSEFNLPAFLFRPARMGATAEYLCLPESGMVALKPANPSYEEAATLPYSAIMAASLLQKANLQPGQKILVNGAPGGIGAMAVQLAKHLGTEVTGVCGTPRLDYVQAPGADKVMDYTARISPKTAKPAL